jgi:hypothetical protein
MCAFGQIHLLSGKPEFRLRLKSASCFLKSKFSVNFVVKS